MCHVSAIRRCFLNVCSMCVLYLLRNQETPLRVCVLHPFVIKTMPVVRKLFYKRCCTYTYAYTTLRHQDYLYYLLAWQLCKLVQSTAVNMQWHTQAHSWSKSKTVDQKWVDTHTVFPAKPSLRFVQQRVLKVVRISAHQQIANNNCCLYEKKFSEWTDWWRKAQSQLAIIILLF